MAVPLRLAGSNHVCPEYESGTSVLLLRDGIARLIRHSNPLKPPSVFFGGVYYKSTLVLMYVSILRNLIQDTLQSEPSLSVLPSLGLCR